MNGSPGVGAEPTFAVDLSNCAREPIHLPGAIQPHGVLLVLREPDLAVLQVSDNVAAHLGAAPDALLGAPVERALGEAAAARLRDAVGKHDLARVNPLRLDVAHPAGTRVWDAILHRTAGGIVLELEPAAAEDPRSIGGLYERVRHGLGRLQGARTLAELCEAVAEETRRLTGFDRVMVYQFDADWHGEVVAEVRAEGIDGFLGLRFPASDIPAQARELYRRNWLRLIADAEYRPAALHPPLNPGTGAPLDMSGSTLRSVSPIHLEYLRNMGVGASMSVSLLREGELWGLIACHHRAPHYIPYDVRTACEFLGQTFSVQLGSLGSEEDREYALHLAAVGGRLLERAAGGAEWADGLVQGEPSLTALAGASGAAVWAGGECRTVGETPGEERIAELVAWLAERGTEIFHTEHLAGHFPPAAEYARVASGLLAAPIGRDRGDFLLWFRPEAVRTVTWAGNPEKPARPSAAPPDGAGAHLAEVPRLHPRRSFAAWTETVHERSTPWRPAELRAAAELRDRMVEIVLRQLDAVARLNDELQRSNEELEAFTYIASHDLKEPLRGIHAFGEMILQDHGERLGDEAVEQVTTVVRLARRMDAMLDSFLKYSRAGQLSLRMVDVDMQELLDEVLDTLRSRLQSAGVEVRVPERLPVLRCDPVRAGSVLQNLISNAVKYNDKPDPWVEIGYRQAGPEAPIVFHVRDNGIGIDARNHDVVFRLFRRLHARERYGGGTGAGLTIARRLVERHGGRIWLASQPGVGSTFHFTLQPEP